MLTRFSDPLQCAQPLEPYLLDISKGKLHQHELRLDCVLRRPEERHETLSVSSALKSTMAVDLRPGDRFLDRFRIEYLAAEGGMASIYAARDELTSHTVAVKVLYPYYADNAIIRSRFVEEGRIQQLLKHPNIVRVFQVLDEPFMAILMEYVEGPTLDDFLADRGPLTQEQVIDVIIPVMSAVGFAHSRGIIHRDIKPSNILLLDADLRRPKVVDFGVAKVKGGRQDLTATGTTVGTLHYMSPEQIVGSKTIDGRADIYSIGVTMYKLVTGEVPFNAPTEFALMMAQVEAPPLPPSRLRPGLSSQLENIILKSMEKRPDDRFQSIKDFTQALLSLRMDGSGTLQDTVNERISHQLLSFAMDANQVAVDRTGEGDFITQPIREPELDHHTAEIESTLKIDRQALLKTAESARYVIPDQNKDSTVQIGSRELAKLTESDDAINPDNVPTENIPSLQSRLKAADARTPSKPLISETKPTMPLPARESQLIRDSFGPGEAAKEDHTQPATPLAKQVKPSTLDHVETMPVERRPNIGAQKSEETTRPTPETVRQSQRNPIEPKPNLGRSGPKMVLPKGGDYADTTERTRQKPRSAPAQRLESGQKIQIPGPAQMSFPPLPTPSQIPSGPLPRVGLSPSSDPDEDGRQHQRVRQMVGPTNLPQPGLGSGFQPTLEPPPQQLPQPRLQQQPHRQYHQTEVAPPLNTRLLIMGVLLVVLLVALAIAIVLRWVT